MSENEEPDWLAELGERHQAMMRDIEQIKQILRGNEPDWLAELAKNTSTRPDGATALPRRSEGRGR